MSWFNTISLRTYIGTAILLIVVFGVTLFFMGQVPWCKCGYIKLWHGLVQSSENSQHISDWYTFSHLIHGFAFYGFLWLVGRRLPTGLRLLLAVFFETSWEIFENTDLIINRYRATTISLDYYGDSIINSVSDVFFMMLGFELAKRLPVWSIMLLTATMEIWVGFWIRDNLTLNIIMLIYPLDTILRWQGG